ncbi:MAG: hypothetical protein ACHREM_07095 [Polyangiales bacterium]
MMFEVIWPELLLSGRFELPPGTLRTAHGALHNALLFTTAMWKADGWVQNPSAHFSETSLGAASDSLVNQFSAPVAELQERFRTDQSFPRAFRNPFVDSPFVLLGDGELLAPDPSILFSAFERLTTAKILSDATAEGGENGFQHASTAIGAVFEDYGRRLLASTDVDPGGRFLPEFKYHNGERWVDSPDAFILRNSQSLVFEFKATRLPFSLESLEQDPGAHLKSWLLKVLGTTSTRGPLDQGREFFRCAPGLQQLNGVGLSDALYLVVVYPDVPPMLNWRTWRTEWLFAAEPLLACDLFHRTAFVSISDLEIAAAASQCGVGVADLVTSWWRSEYNQTGDSTTRRMFGRLGDFCLRTVPEAATREPAMLRQARENLFSAAEVAGFGMTPWNMPLTLWDRPATASWTSDKVLRRPMRPNDESLEANRRAIRRLVSRLDAVLGDDRATTLAAVHETQLRILGVKTRKSNVEGSWEDTWKP